MTVSQVRAAGAGALLVVSLAAGGCGAAGAGGDAAAPASARPLAPRDVLLRALPDASTGSFAFTVKGGEAPTAGQLDAGRQSYRVGFRYREPDAGFTLHMDYLVVQRQSWIKIRFTGAEGLTGLPKLPKKWMLIDPAKVKDDDVPVGYDDETDPGDAGVVLRASADVRQTGAGQFSGTTDLTQQGEADIVDAGRLKALGERAKAVPFEATVDGRGRLTSTVVRIPAAGKAKATRYEVTYAGYGSTPTPAAPAADEQQPATRGAYELLNA
ncbi:hypothetical protein GCM10020358_48440 [Amorphoplanes nipponensis]|uniref:Lipoprotein n=1 Tax=Actinoplanes nipponensis TaxID=135950 RepID=A0A919JNI6_9ACTN|nr:hypothetical protein [Actinoplanes nipponensis]GIE52577.1 hypothetical protein Ani05nite_61110 [Actinoplanes nipponensis]